MLVNHQFVRTYAKGILIGTIFLGGATIALAQQDTVKTNTIKNRDNYVIKTDTAVNIKLIKLIDRHIETAKKENLDANLSTLSGSLSTFQTWLSIFTIVFSLIPIIAGFIAYIYGRDMNRKKVEAEEKLKEIEKLHSDVLIMKNDIKSYKEEMLLKSNEIINLKEIIEYREIKDRISASFLSRMLDYGARSKENTEKIEALIKRLDWLRNNNYEESQYDLYIRGIYAFYNADYEKSLYFFSESLRKDSSHFFHLAFDAKANCLFKLKDFDGGCECAKAILKHIPNDFRALNKLIFYYKLKKDYINAEKYINQMKLSNGSEYIVQKAMLNILQSNPDDSLFEGSNEGSFNTTKGITKLLLKKYFDARDEFKSAIIKINRVLSGDIIDGERESLKYTLAQVNLNMAYCLFKIDYLKNKSTIINLLDESDKIDLKFRDELGIEMINSNYFLFITQEETNCWSELRQVLNA